MPKFRNTLNGVVVNVSDDRAKELPSLWEPVKKQEKPKK